MSILTTRRNHLVAAFALCAGVLVPTYGALYDEGGVHVDATLTGHLDYDSNIFLNSNEVDDYVTSTSAVLKVTRDVALVASQVSAGATATFFGSHSGLNSFDPFLKGSATYSPSDKTTATGGIDYRRNTISNEVLNARTKSNDFNFSGSFQNLFSEKLGYRLLGAYRSNKYLTSGYSDVLSYSLGADAVYVYSPKLKSLLGFDHRESWTENRGAGASDPSSKDSKYFVGFEGILAPKVSGNFNIGVVNRNFNGAKFKDGSAMFLSTGLKWIPRQKTSVSIDASQDFDTTAANQSSKNSTLSVAVVQILDDKWSVDGSVAYTRADYQDAVTLNNRRDNNFRLRGRATYALSSNIGLDFVLGYGDVSSTTSFSTYTRVNAGFGVSAAF